MDGGRRLSKQQSSSGSFRLSNSASGNLSASFSVNIPPAAGAASVLASNLTMSGKMRNGYKRAKIDGRVAPDEIAAFRSLFDLACAEVAGAGDASYAINDTLQAAAELSAAAFNGPDREKRQTVLRRIVGDHSDVTLALARGDRAAVEAKGWTALAADPKGLTFVHRRDALVLHMWQSHRHARRWVSRSSRLAQTLLEHRLQPLAAPVVVMYTTRAFTFTFSPAIPVATAPAEIDGGRKAHAAEIAAATGVLGSLLGFLSPPGDDADLDEIRGLATRKPATQATAEELDVRVGRDGRVYVMNPAAVGIDLLRAAVSGAFASDAMLDAIPTMSPECYHLAFPKGLTAEDGSGAKAAVTAVTTVAVGHVVQGMVKRAADLAKAAGGNMKLMDLLTNDIVAGTMRQHGVNKCFLNVLRAQCKANTTPFAATLAELCEAEMIFRALKFVFRSEALVAADRSDPALLATFTKVYNLFAKADDGITMLLQSVVNAKFDIADGDYVVDPANVKIAKIVLFFVSARLGLSFDTKESKFVKFAAGGTVVSAAATHPDLVKLGQKLPDAATATYAMQSAVWTRLSGDDVEKSLRCARLALLGFWSKPLKPDGAFDQLLKLPPTSWTLDGENRRETIGIGAAALCVSQLDDVPRPAVHKARQALETALDDVPVADPGLFMGWRLRHAAKPAGFAAIAALNTADFGASPSLCEGAVAAVRKAKEDTAGHAVFLAVVFAHLWVAVKGASNVHTSTSMLYRALARACIEAIVSETVPMQRIRVTREQLPNDLPLFGAASNELTCADVICAVSLAANREAIERSSDSPNDVEAVVAAVRLATASAVASKSRHAAVMALLEYAAFVNDSVPCDSIPANEPSGSWSTWYTTRQEDEVRDTVETKAFAVAVGNLILEVLIPAHRWSEAAAIAYAVERHARFFVAAGNTQKFLDAETRLKTCDAAANTIQQAIMPRAVRRPGARATQEMLIRWPDRKDAATPQGVVAQTLVYCSGLRVMEAIAWRTLSFAEVQQREELARAAIGSAEAAERHAETSAFASATGEAAIDGVLRAEASARHEIESDGLGTLFTFLFDAAEQLADAIMRDAFDREWDAPLRQQHSVIAAGAATVALEDDEAAARHSIADESAQDSISLHITITEALAEQVLDDAFTHCWSRPLLQEFMQLTAGAATQAVDSDERNARADIENSYTSATLELLESEAEWIGRRSLVEAEAVGTAALFAELCAAEYGELLRAELVALVEIVNEGQNGATRLALASVQAGEEQARLLITTEQLDAFAVFLERAEQHGRGFRTAEERIVRRVIERDEVFTRVIHLPQARARSDIHDQYVARHGVMLERAAHSVAAALCAETFAALTDLMIACESDRRAIEIREASASIATAIAEGFSSALSWDVQRRETAEFVELCADVAENHQHSLANEGLRSGIDLFTSFALGAHEIAVEEASQKLEELRIGQHNKGVRKLMRNVESTDEPKGRVYVEFHHMRAKSALCLAGHSSYRNACYRDYLAALAQTTVRQERSRRAKLQFELTDNFHHDMLCTFESETRKVLGKDERRARAVLRRELAVLEEEAAERHSIEEQSEKMYRDVEKVMNIMIHAMAAGPRASLLKPSERQLLHRREEASSPKAHSPSASQAAASPSPRPPDQRHLPIGAVVLQDPVLKQQGALLLDMAKMRAEELQTQADAAADALHKKWASAPFEDTHGGRGAAISFSTEVADGPAAEPMTPRTFTNTVTSLFATEAWKRAQILQVHADFISSARIEFREVDTLLRGEKRVIPRTTLLLSLPLVSPLYFSCFRELARRMTKTPEERAREKRMREHGGSVSTRAALSASNVGAHASGGAGRAGAKAGRGRKLSIASSMGTSFSVNGATGFDALQRNVQSMKKLFVACDRGVTAIYNEEDRVWVKLLAKERFGRVDMEERKSLAAAVQAQHTSSLGHDPTATPALALPTAHFATPDGVRVSEAEHRMTVAMAEAEHRFELLQRLTREAPASHRRGPSVFNGTAPIPHYLDARVIRDVAQRRRPPQPLESSPRRNVAGSPPAGAGGYSFPRSQASSHSPAKAPARRRLAPLARTAAGTPQPKTAGFDDGASDDAGSIASTPQPASRRQSLPPLNK